MKRKTKIKQKENNKINVISTLLPFITDEIYKKIKGDKRLHNIKDTFIYD